MHDRDDTPPDGAIEQGPSKSEIKRRMLALQALGETLTTLSDRELAQLPIDDEALLAAIRETRRIRSKNALKRHLQYVGKLMRAVDPEPIEAALEERRRPQQERNVVFHELENLRDALLDAGAAGVERVVERFPEANRQHLRQLVLQHQREMQRDKPPAASRKLFRYLRDLQENQGAGGED